MVEYSLLTRSLDRVVFRWDGNKLKIKTTGEVVEQLAKNKRGDFWRTAR